jgi:flagella basal body P-ring formation protein FlgA
MNGRPLSMRKKVQLMVALTLLAWATQTLFHQWGFGADVPAQERQAPSPEKFVPGTARFAAGATLELRTEATVLGSEVKLKQVCRWSGADDAVFAPLADLVLLRLPDDQAFGPITLDQIRSTLHDAGVNLAVVRFAGPTTCTVARSDAEVDEQQALLEWAHAKQTKPQNNDTARTASNRASADVAETQRAPESAVADNSDHKTLRDLLTQDLSVRLRVPIEDLHVTFSPKDDQALRLAEPQFKFDIQPKRVRNLGPVAWEVQILTSGGNAGTGAASRKSQKMSIAATARAWQRQVVLAKPLAFKQTIRDTDVSERRVLVDTLDDQTLLGPKQVIAQQAARELKPGTVMTGKLVQPVPLARTGQFVTVLLSRGGVTIKTVARAMEEGSYGQTIKVKNEGTRDIFEVVLTGPQEATLGPAETVEASAR